MGHSLQFLRGNGPHIGFVSVRTLWPAAQKDPWLNPTSDSLSARDLEVGEQARAVRPEPLWSSLDRVYVVPAQTGAPRHVGFLRRAVEMMLERLDLARHASDLDVCVRDSQEIPLRCEK